MMNMMTVMPGQIIMVALPFTSSFALLVIGRLFQVITISVIIIHIIIVHTDYQFL